VNSDDEYREVLKRLGEIISIHSRKESDEVDIEEAMNILRDVLVYCNNMSRTRSVQLSQIADNVFAIRRALNSPPGEVNYSYTSQNISNLSTYCGI